MLEPTTCLQPIEPTEEVTRPPSVDRQRYARLAALFGPLDVEILEDIESEVDWLTLESGRTLFRQGEAADAAYVIVRGRLRAAIEEGDGERLLGEMEPGEPVGELALIHGGERSATVYAVRDSELARIPRPGFERLISRYPQLMARLSRIVVQRLQRQTKPIHPPKLLSTLALVPAAPGVPLESFARALERALAVHGTTARLTREAPDAALAAPGVTRLADWLAEREASHRFVVYQAEASDPAWTDRCVRSADHVLIVAAATADPTPGEIERRLERRERPPRRSLVLLHDGEPEGTARWLAGRDVERHYHVRAGRGGDVERLARLLTGNAVGLVLGGGGARGLAHVGVLKALEELGIEVDLVGGTSMGALVAGLVALGSRAADVHRMFARAVTSLRDYTFPAVALLEGRKVREHLHAAFGGRRVEDLAIPFFAVSTNLTRAEQVVHLRGALVDAVRASIALPGIFAPASRGGDLLADGALLNNVPVDVMHELGDGVQVIAVDVSQEVELDNGPGFGTEISGWKLLWSRLCPWRERIRTPSIFSLLQRSALVGSVASRKRTRSLADLYLEPALESWGMLDFEALDQIAERGYASTVEPLRSWRAAAAAASAP